MRLLHAGIDTSVIALWLGHEQVETAQVYLHADLAIKERALAKTKPLDSKPGRYARPTRSSTSSNGSDYATHPRSDPHQPRASRIESRVPITREFP